MDNRLVFQGYATRDLDVAELKFQKRYNRAPEFFAVQSNWSAGLDGSEKNKSKVVVSTLAGFAGVFIPTMLTLAEFLKIENDRSEKKSHAPAHAESGETTDEFSEEIVFKTYCTYCGCLFVPANPKDTFCSSPICAQRHKDYLEHVASVREMVGKAQKNHQPDPIDKTPDFELDDPDRGLLKGFVYFIEAENGLVKVGRSDDISKRFAELATMSPIHLYLRHAIAASNYIRAERFLHEQFAMKRDHGEWFRLTEEELEWAKGLKDYALDLV